MKLYLVCVAMILIGLTAFPAEETTTAPLNCDVAVHPGFIWANTDADGNVILAAECFNLSRHHEILSIEILEITDGEERCILKKSEMLRAGKMYLQTVPWKGSFKRHQIAVRVVIQRGGTDQDNSNNYAARWITQVREGEFIHEVPEKVNWTVPRIADAPSLGTWIFVDKVRHIGDFSPYRAATHSVSLAAMTLFSDGKVAGYEEWSWTKGYLLDNKREIVRRYCIQEIQGMHFLYVEWLEPTGSLEKETPEYVVYVRATPECKEQYPVMEFTPEGLRSPFPGLKFYPEKKYRNSIEPKSPSDEKGHFTIITSGAT